MESLQWLNLVLQVSAVFILPAVGFAVAVHVRMSRLEERVETAERDVGEMRGVQAAQRTELSSMSQTIAAIKEGVEWIKAAIQELRRRA